MICCSKEGKMYQRVLWEVTLSRRETILHLNDQHYAPSLTGSSVLAPSPLDLWASESVEPVIAQVIAQALLPRP